MAAGVSGHRETAPVPGSNQRESGAPVSSQGPDDVPVSSQGAKSAPMSSRGAGDVPVSWRGANGASVSLRGADGASVSLRGQAAAEAISVERRSTRRAWTRPLAPRGGSIATRFIVKDSPQRHKNTTTQNKDLPTRRSAVRGDCRVSAAALCIRGESAPVSSPGRSGESRRCLMRSASVLVDEPRARTGEKPRARTGEKPKARKNQRPGKTKGPER